MTTEGWRFYPRSMLSVPYLCCHKSRYDICDKNLILYVSPSYVYWEETGTHFFKSKYSWNLSCTDSKIMVILSSRRSRMHLLSLWRLMYLNPPVKLFDLLRFCSLSMCSQLRDVTGLCSWLLHIEVVECFSCQVYVWSS